LTTVVDTNVVAALMLPTAANAGSQATSMQPAANTTDS
jgi:hypothetical protein